MRYPIAVEPGDETHAFGVVVPDLPGCYSAGDTLEDGGSVPLPSAPEVLKEAHPEWSDWIWSAVNVNVPGESDRSD